MPRRPSVIPDVTLLVAIVLTVAGTLIWLTRVFIG